MDELTEVAIPGSFTYVYNLLKLSQQTCILVIQYSLNRRAVTFTILSHHANIWAAIAPQRTDRIKMIANTIPIEERKIAA